MYYLSRHAAAMCPAREVTLPKGVYELDAGSVFREAEAVRVFDPLYVHPSSSNKTENIGEAWEK